MTDFVADAKHALALVLALVILALGCAIIINNIKALTTLHIGSGLALIGVSFAIAIPTDFKQAMPTLGDLPIAGRQFAKFGV